MEPTQFGGLTGPHNSDPIEEPLTRGPLQWRLFAIAIALWAIILSGVWAIFR